MTVFGSSLVTLTDSWGAVYPYAPDVVVVFAIHGVESHVVKTLLRLDNIFDRDKSLSGSLYRSHVLYIGVPAFEVSFDITLSW